MVHYSSTLPSNAPRLCGNGCLFAGIPRRPRPRPGATAPLRVSPLWNCRCLASQREFPLCHWQLSCAITIAAESGSVSRRRFVKSSVCLLRQPIAAEGRGGNSNPPPHQHRLNALLISHRSILYCIE